MIPRDILTRHPTWEEMKNVLRPDLYLSIKREVLFSRIDEMLKENAHWQSIVSDYKRTANSADELAEAEREYARLEDDQVALHALRRIEEDK